MAHPCNLSKTTRIILQILTEDLGVRKFSWKMFEQLPDVRIDVASDLLEQVQINPKLFDSVITGDVQLELSLWSRHKMSKFTVMFTVITQSKIACQSQKWNACLCAYSIPKALFKKSVPFLDQQLINISTKMLRKQVNQLTGILHQDNASSYTALYQNIR